MDTKIQIVIVDWLQLFMSENLREWELAWKYEAFTLSLYSLALSPFLPLLYSAFSLYLEKEWKLPSQPASLQPLSARLNR